MQAFTLQAPTAYKGAESITTMYLRVLRPITVNAFNYFTPTSHFIITQK